MLTIVQWASAELFVGEGGGQAQRDPPHGAKDFSGG